MAEFCGWKNVIEDGYSSWICPEGREYQVMHGYQTYKDGTDILPDYQYSLDEMHLVEKFIFNKKVGYYRCAYAEILYSVVCHFPENGKFYLQKPDSMEDIGSCIQASASDKLEAMLRLIKLWEE
jgi:hypothetical protein